MGKAAQDKRFSFFPYILNGILQYIEMWNEFKVGNHCPNFWEENKIKFSEHFKKLYRILTKTNLEK